MVSINRVLLTEQKIKKKMRTHGRYKSALQQAQGKHLRQTQGKLPRCYENLPLNRAWQEKPHYSSYAGYKIIHLSVINYLMF